MLTHFLWWNFLEDLSPSLSFYTWQHKLYVVFQHCQWQLVSWKEKKSNCEKIYIYFSSWASQSLPGMPKDIFFILEKPFWKCWFKGHQSFRMLPISWFILVYACYWTICCYPHWKKTFLVLREFHLADAENENAEFRLYIFRILINPIHPTSFKCSLFF